MLHFIRCTQRPKNIKRIFLVHGEEDRAKKFKEFLNENGFSKVTVPYRGESFEL